MMIQRHFLKTLVEQIGEEDEVRCCLASWVNGDDDNPWQSVVASPHFPSKKKAKPKKKAKVRSVLHLCSAKTIDTNLPQHASINT
jgi:hypothetical protein